MIKGARIAGGRVCVQLVGAGRVALKVGAPYASGERRFVYALTTSGVAEGREEHCMSPLLYKLSAGIPSDQLQASTSRV